MRTQEQIMKGLHKYYRVYLYLHSNDKIRHELIIAAADQKEADEIALNEVKKAYPAFADTLFIKGVRNVG